MVASLRDFLVSPSPIISKLNKYSLSSGGGNSNASPGSIKITITDEDRNGSRHAKKPKDKLMTTLENLRDNAIHNICRYRVVV